MYSSQDSRFTDRHRKRLLDAGVRFIYIPLENKSQFRQQVEKHLEAAMRDRSWPIAAKAELLYETGVELADESLVAEELGQKIPRLEALAKAATTLVTHDTSTFSHLFAVSQHDSCPATHMMNVGSWMVPLASACGIHDVHQLSQICLAGILHDIGKIFVPKEVLKKAEQLTEADWRLLRSHPILGKDHLKNVGEGISPVVLEVVAQHHERMDGNGYPGRLSSFHISPASRICAVVDSFDAMTAFQPFRNHAKSFGEAIRALQEGSGLQYDKEVVDAWVKLMQQAESDGVIPRLRIDETPASRRRGCERFAIDCPGKVHVMKLRGGEQAEGPGMEITAHDLSRTGLGFLCHQPMFAGQLVRVYLRGMGTLRNKMIEGIAVRCRKLSDGWYEVGVAMRALKEEAEAAKRVEEARSQKPEARSF